MPLRVLVLAIVALATCAFHPVGTAGPGERLPSLRIAIRAPAAESWDRVARALERGLRAERFVGPILVFEGAPAVALADLLRSPGDGPIVALVGLATVGALALDRSDSPAPLAGVTPIAQLTSEPLVVAVPAASRLRSLRELTSALSSGPSAVGFSGGPRGGGAHVLAGLLAEAVGVAPARVRYLAADGAGAIGAALRGMPDATAVIGTPAELRTHLESGELRALAVSTAARWPGLAVPTLREQGVDVELGSWVGVVAPAGIAPADRKALLDVVDRLARSAVWKEQLRQQGWQDAYLLGEAFGAQLVRERERAARVLHGAATGR